MLCQLPMFLGACPSVQVRPRWTHAVVVRTNDGEEGCGQTTSPQPGWALASWQSVQTLAACSARVWTCGARAMEGSMHWEIFGEPPGFSRRRMSAQVHVTSRNPPQVQRVNKATHVFCHPHEKPQRQIRWRRHEVQDVPHMIIEREGLRCLRDLACLVSAGDMSEWNTYSAEGAPEHLCPAYARSLHAGGNMRGRSLQHSPRAANYVNEFRLHVTRSTFTRGKI